MSCKCRSPEQGKACFKPTDPASRSVDIYHTTVYNENGSIDATYFYDRDGNAIDEATFLGGGVASIGACAENQVDCVESQEWTYGLDNTGTRFNDVASYTIELSNGQTLEFSQDGTDASWSQQLTSWAAAIQTAADNAGYLWFAEPRFIDNFNPTNIDGTINGPGGTPSGLPGAPSEVLAQALFDNGMFWRYVNIQICPGQPTPTALYRTESTIYGDGRFDLVTAGAILGPVNRFFVCRSCGDSPIWYLADGVTEASAGQIPNCWEPCGTLSLLPPPPDTDCSFVFEIGCDDGGADPNNQITRRATFCSGAQVALNFYEADPGDPSALIDYTLIGNFVDCDSGVIQDPPDDPNPCDKDLCDVIETCGESYRTQVSTNRGGWNDPRSSNFQLPALGLGPFATSGELVAAIEALGGSTTLVDAGSGTGDTSFFTVTGLGDPGQLTWNPFSVDSGNTPVTQSFELVDGSGSDALLVKVCNQTIQTPTEVPFVLPQVCANVDGTSTFVTPVVVYNGFFSAPTYFDRMGVEITLDVTEADPCDCDCSCAVTLNARCTTYGNAWRGGYQNWIDEADFLDLADSEFGITPTANEMWVRITEFDCDGTSQSQNGQIFGPYPIGPTAIEAFSADLQTALDGSCLQISSFTPGASGGQITFDRDDGQEITLSLQEGVTVGAGPQWFTSLWAFTNRGGLFGDTIFSTGQPGPSTNIAALDQAGIEVEGVFVEGEDCTAI